MHSRNKARKFLKNSGDILLLALSFLAGATLAKQHAGLASSFLPLGTWEVYLLLFFCLAWNFGARVFGLYDEFRNRSWGVELTALGKNIMLQALSAILVLFLAKSRAYSRFFVFIFYMSMLAFAILWRVLLRLFFAWQQKNGRSLCHVLVIGGGTLARSFAETVSTHHHLGYRLKGFIASDFHPEMGSLYLGKIDQLAGLLERGKIDEIVIAFTHSANDEIGRIIAVCGNYPVQVRIVPENFRFMNVRSQILRFGPFPLFSYRAIPLEQAHWRILKRGFDLLVTLLSFILVFSWLWPLLALLIKATSPGPVFFKQERWGEKNKRILCFKFRSMVKESTDVDENGRYQQVTRNDPRVTRLGRFLRHSNLDELPQFINVLRGEMSLVGPRPHPTPLNLEAKNSIRHYQLRHLIKPGITGWAQVKGFRGEISDPRQLRRRVAADIWYIENWSFLLDLKIVWRSILAMLMGDPRAY